MKSITWDDIAAPLNECKQRNLIYACAIKNGQFYARNGSVDNLTLAPVNRNFNCDNFNKNNKSNLCGIATCFK